MRNPLKKRGTPKPKPTDSGEFLSTIVTRIGQVVALLAGLAIIAIIIDQWRHYYSNEYTLQQRTKHEFMCYRHSREVPVPVNGNHLEERRAGVEQNVYLLMDIVRQQNAPTEFFGKLRQFSLCSSFSKVGFGGFEATGAKDTGQSVLRIGEDEAAIMMGSLGFLKDQYPDFPKLSARKLRCELRILVNFDEAPFAVCKDAKYFAPELEPIVVEAASDDAWLLVVGADQTDAAAVDQVKTTRQILKNSETTVGDSEKVELRLIRSWRRTVVVFDTEDAAQGALKELGTTLPYGAYVRRQSNWCPDLADAEAISNIPTKVCELASLKD